MTTSLLYVSRLMGLFKPTRDCEMVAPPDYPILEALGLLLKSYIFYLLVCLCLGYLCSLTLDCVVV